MHGNQEPHAWATILWDNAFAEWGRQPFLVPDKVPWIQVAATLDVKFKASCGRGLTEDNLRFLGSKVYRQVNQTKRLTFIKQFYKLDLISLIKNKIKVNIHFKNSIVRQVATLITLV